MDSVRAGTNRKSAPASLVEWIFVGAVVSAIDVEKAHLVTARGILIAWISFHAEQLGEVGKLLA
jgi:hypothetical protein